MLVADFQDFAHDLFVLANAVPQLAGTDGTVQKSFIAKVVLGDVLAKTFAGRFDFAGDRPLDVPQGHLVHFHRDHGHVVGRVIHGSRFDNHDHVHPLAGVFFRDEVKAAVGLHRDAAELVVDDAGERRRNRLGRQRAMVAVG